jgi:hypothetical protein
MELDSRELKALPGNDRRKVEIAARLQENTTVSLSWIADQLRMISLESTASNLSLEVNCSTRFDLFNKAENWSIRRP